MAIERINYSTCDKCGKTIELKHGINVRTEANKLCLDCLADKFGPKKQDRELEEDNEDN